MYSRSTLFSIAFSPLWVFPYKVRLGLLALQGFYEDLKILLISHWLSLKQLLHHAASGTQFLQVRTLQQPQKKTLGTKISAQTFLALQKATLVCVGERYHHWAPHHFSTDSWSICGKCCHCVKCLLLLFDSVSLFQLFSWFTGFRKVLRRMCCKKSQGLLKCCVPSGVVTEAK